MTRRGALGALSAAAATPAAALQAPGEQVPGVFRTQVGGIGVTVLSDGHLTIPASGIATNVPEEELEAFLTERFLSPETNYSHTNHVLIETGDETVLVDVGSGERFQPSAGRLATNLEAAGHTLEDVTLVALTHAHPDHVWGLIDDFDELRYPEAAYAVQASEYDWWMAEGRVDEVPEAMQAFVVGAQRSLEPIAERATMVEGEAEIAPGVTMVPTPGHTPGHASLVVSDGGESLLVTGDAILHAHASFEHPDWVPGFDFAPEQAVATRKRLLDMAAADRMPMVGYHLPFPGLGYATRSGSAYRYHPALWRWGE